jgi:hypothetical protein
MITGAAKQAQSQQAGNLTQVYLALSRFGTALFSLQAVCVKYILPPSNWPLVVDGGKSSYNIKLFALDRCVQGDRRIAAILPTDFYLEILSLPLAVSVNCPKPPKMGSVDPVSSSPPKGHVSVGVHFARARNHKRLGFRSAENRDRRQSGYRSGDA